MGKEEEERKGDKEGDEEGKERKCEGREQDASSFDRAARFLRSCRKIPASSHACGVLRRSVAFSLDLQGPG